MKALNAARLCLDRMTMHRVVLLSLLALVAWAVMLSSFGVLGYRSWDIAGAALLSVGVAVLTNHAFDRVVRATSEVQSSIITGLILALLVPVGLADNWAFLAGASFLAIASKYLVTVERQHIFNPAALAVLAIPLLFPGNHANWWVGTLPMTPAVAIFGGLIVLKTRKGSVVAAFLVLVLVIAFASTAIRASDMATGFDAARVTVVSTAVLFFAFVMLTDPIAIPSDRLGRHAYAVMVGLLYATPDLGLRVVLTPEAAICAGNAISFFTRPRYRLAMTLVKKWQAGPEAWSFEYATPRPVTFHPGQYMEWVLPHPEPDGRGQRRYFSIASSPTERNLHLLVRVPPLSSSYKRAMVASEPGSTVVAGRLHGDFVLPADLKGPIALVAGGVGVAPFRSMARYVADRGLRCDITLMYSVRTPAEFLFEEVFGAAEPFGWRTVRVLTGGVPEGWAGARGRITKETIADCIPDFRKRLFFVSGSHPFVAAIETELRSLGVKRSRVRKDFFDGLVDT